MSNLDCVGDGMTITSPLQERAVSGPSYGHDLIVIGASAGGVSAISTLLSGLPADLPAAVLIVLHLSQDAGNMLPRIFDDASHMPVKFAEDGVALSYGDVWIAPPDRHLLVEPGVMRVVR